MSAPLRTRRRLVLAAGCALATIAAAPPHAAARQRAVPPAPTGIVLDVVRDGQTFAVTARADMQGDASVAWATMTDYERLPQFIPHLTRVQVLARAPRPRGEVLTVEYDGTLKLLFLTVPTRVRLEVEHVPFTDVLARLAAPAPGGAASLRRFEGRYTLSVVGAGAGGSSGGSVRTRLDYNATFELAQPLPPVLGTLFGTSAVRSMLREQFAALVSEIERRTRARQGLTPSR
jgi:WD40 repeat protein